MMHKHMSKGRALSALMTCVAVITLSACGWNNNPEPSGGGISGGVGASAPSATPNPKVAKEVQVYPEKGYSEDIYGKRMTGETTMSKNKVACADALKTRVRLGSTIMLDGMTITGSKKGGVVRITFSPMNEVKYGGVVNGDTPFRVPGFDVEDGSDVMYVGQPLLLVEEDFGGKIRSVVLCGGGM